MINYVIVQIVIQSQRSLISNDDQEININCETIDRPIQNCLPQVPPFLGNTEPACSIDTPTTPPTPAAFANLFVRSKLLDGGQKTGTSWDSWSENPGQ